MWFVFSCWKAMRLCFFELFVCFGIVILLYANKKVLLEQQYGMKLALCCVLLSFFSGIAFYWLFWFVVEFELFLFWVLCFVIAFCLNNNMQWCWQWPCALLCCCQLFQALWRKIDQSQGWWDASNGQNFIIISANF